MEILLILITGMLASVFILKPINDIKTKSYKREIEKLKKEIKELKEKK